MRLKTALVSLLLLCPCALCYGQLRFASVGGEKGYSALRASYRADLDNDWILTPQYGYYRMSDKEVDEAGSTSRYGLEVRYEWFDSLDLLVSAIWQPRAVGYEAVLYQGGAAWRPFYYWAGLKNPVLTVQFGQTRTRSHVDIQGHDLPDGAFRQVGTLSQLEGAVEVGSHWLLQATWQKVIKYSSRVPPNVTFSWAEVPYMTAVLQGFIKDSTAARVSYRTRYVTPYAALVRYHYDLNRSVAAAVSAGMNVRLWGVEVTGGIEVFEPRRDENRKTFFSLSVEMPL
ncbi:MAG: hypothetical protein J6X06_02875 [Elusimicrobiaceae bacterium]|nr:hypothetical protein [Elusimicrobiaceae bacterium]